jgi:hypothetical protein
MVFESTLLLKMDEELFAVKSCSLFVKSYLTDDDLFNSWMVSSRSRGYYMLRGIQWSFLLARPADIHYPIYLVYLLNQLWTRNISSITMEPLLLHEIETYVRCIGERPFKRETIVFYCCLWSSCIAEDHEALVISRLQLCLVCNKSTTIKANCSLKKKEMYKQEIQRRVL